MNVECLKKRLYQRAEFGETVRHLRNKQSVVVEGLLGGGYALLIAALVEQIAGVVLVVTAKPGEVDRLAGDLEFFTTDPLDIFPMLPETIVEKEDAFFHHEDIEYGNRLRCLKTLTSLNGPSSGKRQILVTSLSALLQPVPSPAEIAENTLVLTQGAEYPPSTLIGWLAATGFQSVTAVELPGEYSLRGNILDIFPADWKEPVRLEFWGDEIDSIRRFDPATQCSLAMLERIELSRLHRQTTGGSLLTESLPEQTTLILIETDQILREIQNLIRFEQIDTRLVVAEGSEAVTIASVMNRLYRFPTLHAVSFASGNEPVDVRLSIPFKSVERFCGSLTQIFGNESLAQEHQGEDFILVSQTEAETTRLTELLAPTVLARANRLTCVRGNLSAGFDWSDEKVIVLAANELLGRLGTKRSSKRNLGKVIDSFLELTPGDLVIHVGHGLARFRGLKMLKRAQLEEEHLELEFANNTAVYVPVSHIPLVQKYVGTGKSAPRLATIGGSTWTKQKQSVQGAVMSLALEMLDLQAARQTLSGTIFPADSEWQQEFEGSFPFQETPDQLSAIASIKGDMQRPMPMDRLLCGDVGFGKTEVAIRAAFKAADAGFQTVVLVPTTVLAEQHVRVFKERMAAFPISIEVYSRFTPPAKQREIKEALKEGTLDIVIGTHGLTRGEFEYANLGLVVIDEEQKFGVKDKEHLVKMRQLVDVLTMTATPIPRTLHFSLLGLRDISNLETPPENRLPVETRVVRYDSDLIRKAILREMQRQGQVYFVHNRVLDIEEVAHKLRNIVPEARIGVGHAQMSDDELESVMRDFVLQKYDVLVCTTIIESGLDIPRANTIFIDFADRFGLAELHQLRGRVGRDQFQAYCYLLLEANQFLTPSSSKRLKAIEEYSHLGAGFHIAMRDLEIRGAGNILGTQQSGHIALVGYEMYCDFLEGAVRALRRDPPKKVIEVEVDLPGTALIPKEYISDQRTKIDVYRRILRATEVEQVSAIETELQDRFGKIPQETARILQHTLLRLAAWEYRIYSIHLAQELSAWHLMMKFHHEQRMEELRVHLQKKNIPLRITEKTKGYVLLPATLFSTNGEVLPDELIRFTRNLFV